MKSNKTTKIMPSYIIRIVFKLYYKDNKKLGYSYL